VHDTRDPSLTQSYLAERGDIVKREPSNYLVMSKGHIVRRTDKSEPAQIVAFDKYAVDLDRFEKKIADDIDLKPRERYFNELVNPNPDSPRFRAEPGKFRAELHERSSNPLYPIAFALIALAALGQAHSTRQSRIKQVSLAFVLAAGLRLGGLALSNVVALDADSVPLLYGLPLMGILLPLIVIERARHRLTTGILPRAVIDLFDRLGEAVRSLPILPARAPGAKGR
jgi:lipopolysaccharide export system permease protein